MAEAFTCCSWRTTTLPVVASSPAVDHSPTSFVQHHINQQRRDDHIHTKGQLLKAAFAAKSGTGGGGFSLDSIINRCQTCRGQGAIDCAGCKGTGKNKKNGNIFERWKCYDCQGFGLKSCPSCGQGRGLTPEQRGER